MDETSRIKRLYYNYRQYDRKHNLSLPDYSVAEFHKRIREGKCLYCLGKEKLGLDRIDNKKGHTKDNTVVCCGLCNKTRSDNFSVEEMKLLGSVIRRIKINRIGVL